LQDVEEIKPMNNRNHISNQQDPSQQPSELPLPLADSADHKVITERAANPGKRCELSQDWCRVCEKMSDIHVVSSEDLLQGRREVLIVHGDEVYRLLCTRNNKLILQK
jgi:hemin uptake protein HemP